MGWGAVSDLSLISDLSQKFKHDLWRVKSELNLSQKQHLTPDAGLLKIDRCWASSPVLDNKVFIFVESVHLQG